MVSVAFFFCWMHKSTYKNVNRVVCNETHLSIRSPMQAPWVCNNTRYWYGVYDRISHFVACRFESKQDLAADFATHHFSHHIWRWQLMLIRVYNWIVTVPAFYQLYSSVFVSLLNMWSRVSRLQDQSGGPFSFFTQHMDKSHNGRIPCQMEFVSYFRWILVHSLSCI